MPRLTEKIFVEALVKYIRWVMLYKDTDMINNTQWYMMNKIPLMIEKNKNLLWQRRLIDDTKDEKMRKKSPQVIKENIHNSYGEIDHKGYNW